MGFSKFFCLGNQNKGATPFKDYTKLSAQPSRPKSNIIRTWIDSLGIMNFLGASGPGIRTIIGSQEDIEDAVTLKHANTNDHAHGNQDVLDQVSGVNTGDQDLSILPQAGQGALGVNALGGNPRGANASDFQFVRDTINRVASGAKAFIGGGESNEASGVNVFIAAGKRNVVSGLSSMASGEYNEISGEKSTACGSGNIISGNQSFTSGEGNHVNEYAGHAEGNGNVVNSVCSHAEGSLNECNGAYSHAEGLCAKTYNDYQHAKASWDFFGGEAKGEAQYTNIIARIETADANPWELLVGEEGHIILMNDKMNAFRVMVVVTDDNISDGAAYELKGLIRKRGTASSTALIGSVTKTVISETIPELDVNISADTVNGALKIEVTGQEEVVLRWVAFIEMVEVAFYG